MSDFRRFSLGIVLSLLALMILRRLAGVTGIMPLDEIARVAFLTVVGAFAFTAVFGKASQ